MKSDDTLDKILVQVGDFGKYQVFTFSLICLVVIIHSGVHIAYVFTALDTEYRCEIPGCDVNGSIYEPVWIKNAVPYTNLNKPSKCDMYAFKNITNLTCSANDFNQKEVVRCKDHLFTTNEHYIGRDFNLLCEDNLWKLSLVGTINNIGQFFGLFVAGIVSDRFGRKFVLLVGMAVCGVFGLLKSLSSTYIWFLVLEFIEAFFGAGTYACGFIMGVELVAPKKRVLTGCIVSSCYAIGEVYSATAAWITKAWKPTIYMLYTPAVFILLLYWLIPESVRWNLSKGNVEEAKQTLRNVARINKKLLKESAFEKLTVAELEEEAPTNNFMDIIRSTPLLLRFINCAFCWITCAFLFYGLTLNSVSLSGNSYLDFILTSLVEIPAYCSCTYFVEKIGRKFSLSGSFVVTTIACLSFIFVSADSYWQNLVVYLLGKFGATSAFIIVYVVTSEIFPTPLRHTMMGTCSTIGRLGSMLSPQTPLLAQIWKPLPLVMFSSLAGVAGILTLFFPETANIKLPDTIEEAESIGRANREDS